MSRTLACVVIAFGLSLLPECGQASRREVASETHEANAALPSSESGQEKAASDRMEIVLRPDEPWLSSDGSLEIIWVGVTDSRCPIGARCIRAGEATVRLEYDSVPAGNRRTATLILPAGSSGQDDRSSVTIDERRLELIEVLPHPELDSSIEQTSPTVRLSVTSADDSAGHGDTSKPARPVP
jgi:hypothetical protein